MRSLVDYILERKDVIEIYDRQNHKLNPSSYAYDEETLNELEQIKSSVYIARFNNNRWIADMNEPCRFNSWQPFSKYLESEKSSYTKNDIIDMMNKGEIMIITI